MRINIGTEALAVNFLLIGLGLVKENIITTHCFRFSLLVLRSVHCTHIVGVATLFNAKSGYVGEGR